VIDKSAFVVKSRRIVRDPARDIAVVREHLDSVRPHGSLAEHPKGAERVLGHDQGRATNINPVSQSQTSHSQDSQR
jgi:hypothetical protein